MARLTRGRIYKPTGGRDQNYWLDYTAEKTRHRVSLKTPDKAEAEAEAERVLRPYQATAEAQRTRLAYHALTDAEETAKVAVEAARRRLTIADAWSRFESDPARPQSGPVALKDYSQRWDRFVQWAATSNRQTMEEIREPDAKAFASTLTGLSPNRFNKIIQTCRLVYRVLSPQCADMANPFARIATRKLKTNSHRELSEDELRAICGAATGELRTLLAIGLFTALRLHDAACLQWDSVSFTHDRIALIPHKTVRTGKTIIIPMHPILRTILAETPAGQRKAAVLPETASLYKEAPYALSERIQNHFVACGIQTQEKVEGHRAVVLKSFHSLRHSFVSIAAAAGIPLGVVQELCGHGSPAIQRHYLHIGEVQARAAVNSMPSVLEPPKALPAKADNDAMLRQELHAMVDQADASALRRMIEAGKQ